MPSIDAIRAAGEAIDFVNSLEPSSLIRRDELGELDFSSIQNDLITIKKNYQLIRIASLEQFPNSYISMIIEKKNQLSELLERIRGFNLSIGGAPQLHSDITNQIKNLLDQSSEQFAPIIGFSYAIANDISSIQSQFQTLQMEIDSEVRSARQSSQEIEAILGRARELSAEQGISRESKHFQNIADDHEIKANIWLTISVMMSVFTIIVAGFLTFTYKIPELSPRNNFESAQLISGKIFFMSLLVYLVVSFLGIITHTGTTPL